MRIGILALQGAFAEHRAMLHSLGVDTLDIRRPQDLRERMAGLILPGGESTVMGKLLRETDMLAPLRTMIRNGLPVFGTCAGLILLAGRLENDSTVHIGTMDILARRNAYGRQLGSFRTKAVFADEGPIPMTFIRAPYIAACGIGVTALATVQGKTVAARQGHQLVTAFHPELTNDTTVHRYFLTRCCR